MRLLVVNASRTIIGGAETYLRAVLPCLRRRGIEVRLACESEGATGASRIDVGLPSESWLVERQGIAHVLRAIRSWRPDVALLNGLASSSFEEAIQSAAPSVLFAHNYYGTCLSGEKRHAFPFPVECQRTFGAACLAIYYPRRCGGLNPWKAGESYRIQRARRHLLPNYAGVIVASDHMKAEYERHGIDPSAITVAPYFPVELSITTSSEDSSNHSEATRHSHVLMLGRLTSVKGGMHLITAIAMASRLLNRSLRLVVGGLGPEQEHMARLAHRLNVEAQFVGWVEGERLADLLRTAAVLAVPSIWPEPFGIVGIEAGRYGLPAVAYAVGGIPEWLEDGITGDLARPGPSGAEPRHLAQALARTLGDPARYKRLRKGAAAMAKRFTPERHLDAVIPALQRAAGRSRK